MSFIYLRFFRHFTISTEPLLCPNIIADNAVIFVFYVNAYMFFIKFEAKLLFSHKLEYGRYVWTYADKPRLRAYDGLFCLFRYITYAIRTQLHGTI